MNNSSKFKFILASKSIGRQRLLKQINIPFEIKPANIDESLPQKMTIPETVQFLAKKKALFVANKFPNSFVIGADTLCLISDKILGKPHDREKAINMLQQLQGNIHWLYSGQAIVSPTGFTIVDYDKTAVKFKEMNLNQIKRYVDVFKPYSFAGGYQMEGLSSLFIEKIEGNPSTVLGLSLPKIYEMFQKLGIDLLDHQLDKKF